MGETTVNGVRLGYDTFGDGPPVLLVCGTGQPALSWQLFQVPALTAAGFRVVTFDNRGVAPSDAPPAPYTVPEMVGDAAALIEELDLGPCFVAGLSLGAMITQELALARPDLVRGAVMMGTMGRQDAFRRAVTRSWIQLDESGIELPPFSDAVHSAFTLFSPDALNDDERISMFIEVSAAAPPWTGPGKLGQHQADIAYDDRLGALGGVQVPAMVVAFELDMLTASYLCREVADAIPGCRYVEIPRCGHAGPLEKPDEVNAVLIDFFREVGA